MYTKEQNLFGPEYHLQRIITHACIHQSSLSYCKVNRLPEGCDVHLNLCHVLGQKFYSNGFITNYNNCKLLTLPEFLLAYY